MPVQSNRSRPRHPLLHDPQALFDIRVNAGKSLRQLADDVGCSPSYMAEIQRGSRSPSPKLLKRIATVLDCAVADLRPSAPADTEDVA